MKLGIGTVQFGLDYGISNERGKTTEGEVARILSFAQARGVKVIDTARLYGDSEDVLGRTLPDGDRFDVVTKTITFRKEVIGDAETNAFREGFQASLSALRRKSVYGLLLHHADDLRATGGGKLFRAMEEFRQAGQVQKLGASVYDGEQIDFLLAGFDIDLVQLPLSIFDQRLLRSGHLEKLKARGVEVHVRSAFLQGLVFMNPESLPERLASLRPNLEGLAAIQSETGLSRLRLALGFLYRCPFVDRVVCGVNTLSQFKELCAIPETVPELENQTFDTIAASDPMLINPANW